MAPFGTYLWKDPRIYLLTVTFLLTACVYAIQNLQQCALRRMSLPISSLKLTEVGGTEQMWS